MNVERGERARVFGLKVSERKKRTVVGKISTYEGNDQDGNGLYSQWFTNFVGKAYEQALTLDEGDKIMLLQAVVTDRYIKEKRRSYTNVTVFELVKIPEEKKKEKATGENEGKEHVSENKKGNTEEPIYFMDDGTIPEEEIMEAFDAAIQNGEIQLEEEKEAGQEKDDEFMEA